MANGFLKRGMNYLGLTEEDEDGAFAPDEISEGLLASRRVSEEEADSWGDSEEAVGPVQRRPSATVSMITPRIRRTASTELSPHVHAVTPTQFADATEIADSVMRNQPVIVNLGVADRELKRRMIDFCSGVAYALGGGMERVANNVFLVTPSDVELSAEERQPWQQEA